MRDSPLRPDSADTILSTSSASHSRCAPTRQATPRKDCGGERRLCTKMAKYVKCRFVLFERISCSVVPNIGLGGFVPGVLCVPFCKRVEKKIRRAPAKTSPRLKTRHTPPPAHKPCLGHARRALRSRWSRNAQHRAPPPHLRHRGRPLLPARRIRQSPFCPPRFFARVGCASVMPKKPSVRAPRERG